MPDDIALPCKQFTDARELNIMRIFSKERESLRIRKARASRAIYVDKDVQEIDLEVETEDGERLTLRMSPRVAHTIISHMQTSYEAINPPLNRGSAAQWDGMMD
jgi:hypothetical protein